MFTLNDLSPTEAFIKRFWTFVDKSGGQNACWPWIGYKKESGYGRTYFAGRQWLSHRVAFLISNGPLSASEVTRHSCDNPVCCNPLHLTRGTPRENVQDMLDRARQPIGERNGNATLTDNQVRLARAVYVRGKFGSRKVAELLGVNQAGIASVLTGKRWRHIV